MKGAAAIAANIAVLKILRVFMSGAPSRKGLFRPMTRKMARLAQNLSDAHHRMAGFDKVNGDRALLLVAGVVSETLAILAFCTDGLSADG